VLLTKLLLHVHVYKRHTQPRASFCQNTWSAWGRNEIQVKQNKYYCFPQEQPLSVNTVLAISFFACLLHAKHNASSPKNVWGKHCYLTTNTMYMSGESVYSHVL